MLLQAIMIDDRAYEVEKASRASSARYIFPNGCLPSLEVIARCLARHTDLRIARPRGPDPALRRDAAALARELRAQPATSCTSSGYDERFRRLWRLYLAYCEAGFAERRIGVVQMLLAKPRWRPSIDAAPARQLGDPPRDAADPEQPAHPVGAVERSPRLTIRSAAGWGIGRSETSPV